MPRQPRQPAGPKPAERPPANGLTHLDSKGNATMVDVGHKPMMHRVAIAEGEFVANPSTLDRLMAGDLPKGEALGVARIAGISAAKRTDELIPLCHSLPMDQVTVSFHRSRPNVLRVEASARVTAKTGVEMEALTAVTVACLTLYDMTKAIDKKLVLRKIRLVSKTKTPC